MRVLVVAQYFPPDMGGASTRALNIIKGLKAQGHQVVVIAGFPHYPHGNIPKEYKHRVFSREVLSPLDIEIIRTWMPSIPSEGFIRRLILFFSFMLSALFGLLLVGGIDIIWAANPNFFSVFPAKVYSLIKRVPIIRNVDDLWPEAIFDLGFIKSTFIQRVLIVLSKLTYHIPKALTPISEVYKQTIIKKYGVPPSQIRVIEVGVDTSIFKPLTVRERDLRLRNKFVVMYSGIFGPNYDFDLILEAAKELQNDIDLIFFLRGFGEMTNWIQERVKSLELTNVIIENKFLDLQDLNCLLNQGDVFLLTHQQFGAAESGLPTKLFEYQACRKPIICASAGEPGGYINRTKSGIVVNPGDLQGFINAVKQLKSNRELTFRLGENGYKFVRENLTFEHLGKRMSLLFQDVKSNDL